MSHTTVQPNAKQNIYEICSAEKSQYTNRHFILRTSILKIQIKGVDKLIIWFLDPAVVPTL